MASWIFQMSLNGIVSVTVQAVIPLFMLNCILWQWQSYTHPKLPFDLPFLFQWKIHDTFMLRNLSAHLSGATISERSYAVFEVRQFLQISNQRGARYMMVIFIFLCLCLNLQFHWVNFPLSHSASTYCELCLNTKVLFDIARKERNEW